MPKNENCQLWARRDVRPVFKMRLNGEFVCLTD